MEQPTLDARDIIDIILAEYGALRNEIICCLTNQYQVWSFGTPVIAAAFVLGFSIWSNPWSILVFFGLIPYLVIIFMLLWGNQVARMNRAGAYISDFVEGKFEVILGKQFREYLPLRSDAISEQTLHKLPPKVISKLGADRRIESIEEAFRSVIGWEAWLRSIGLSQFYASFRPWRYYPYTQKRIIYVALTLCWTSVAFGIIRLFLLPINIYGKAAIGILILIGLFWVCAVIFRALGDVTTRKRLDPASDYIYDYYRSWA